MKISVFKDLFKSKEVPYIVDLEKIIQRIKVGKSKDVIDKIRSSKNKELKTALKNTLPSILFAGEFSQRNSNSLVNHSGLMVVDFDGYPSKEDMAANLELLKQNNHFILLFISPSGGGIKGVVKIPKATKETHVKYFKAFHAAFKYDHFDNSNCNVDRVCFESYDPDIYVNYDAVVFEPEINDNGYDRTERIPLLPIDDEDKIISKIMAFNWHKSFVEGQRNSFVFDLAGAFCEYGISQTTALGYIQNNVTYGDFSDKECEAAIKSAYRSRKANTKFFEDYAKIERIKVDLKKGKIEVVKTHKISEEAFDYISEEIESNQFWHINEKGKVTVNPLKYKLFLENNGYKKHFPNGGDKPIFVYVNSNKVEISNVNKIKDFVLDFLMSNHEIEVWNYCAAYQNLFSENYLNMLDSIDLMMLNDTKEKSFIAYQNGILEITKDEIKLVDYIDVDGYVWSSHILPRDFVVIEENVNDYSKFINNISNGDSLPFEVTLGYLMSTYKNFSNNKAVILNDEDISENPEGGTGKGLIVQGIAQIRKTSILDGKQFDGKKSFAYQTVAIDTRLLVFDDVRKNFNFEDNFSLVTEGLTIERKGMDAIKLNVHDSPKVIISTNYAIKGEGNSHDRRRHEIEIGKHYGKHLTPEDDFGRQLFNDWDLLEFQKFDNYMVGCIQKFLKLGLIKQNSKNIRLRKLIAETSMEFYEWVNDKDNFPLNIRNDKDVMFTSFTNEYQDYKKFLNRKTFNRWISKYAGYLDASFKQGHSMSVRWYMIVTKENLVAEEALEDELQF